jgi:hypothetical protein
MEYLRDRFSRRKYFVSYLKRINPKLSPIDDAIESRHTANGGVKTSWTRKSILKYIFKVRSPQLNLHFFQGNRGKLQGDWPH